MLKRFLSVMLSLAMVFCGCLSAFAEETALPESMPPAGMAPPEGGNGTPPEKPDGNPPGGGNGQPPAGPDGAPPEGGFGGGTPPGGGSADFEYTAAMEITSETAEKKLTDESFISEAADESALIINTDEAVEISNAMVVKTGDSDGGDSCSFYGLNAAVLVMGGSVTTITGGSIESHANGANGVFSYGGNGGRNGAEGDGTTVVISDTEITTTGDGSGGIMTTGGGITYASGLTVQTSGRSSAAIRTDRGGGTVVVDGGTYSTNGLGSPAIYSTADVTVKNASLISNLSEGICIEGKNAVTLENCNLAASNTKCNGNASFLDTVMIYQSMSGDADSGTSSFTMTGGTLTSLSGHMFHVTNTHAVITLSGVQLVNEGDDVLLSVCDDGWSGAANIAELVADAQELSGTLLAGSNSTLTLSLLNGSSFTGCVSGEITDAEGNTVSSETGTVHVKLDETSTWTLTSDTYITSFEGDPASVTGNGYSLYVDGTILEGIR